LVVQFIFTALIFIYQIGKSVTVGGCEHTLTPTQTHTPKMFFDMME
jgi:hypothetical protein